MSMNSTLLTEVVVNAISVFMRGDLGMDEINLICNGSPNINRAINLSISGLKRLSVPFPNKA